VPAGRLPLRAQVKLISDDKNLLSNYEINNWFESEIQASSFSDEPQAKRFGTVLGTLTRRVNSLYNK
jgi:hypothetical protein